MTDLTTSVSSCQPYCERIGPSTSSTSLLCLAFTPIDFLPGGGVTTQVSIFTHITHVKYVTKHVTPYVTHVKQLMSLDQTLLGSSRRKRTLGSTRTCTNRIRGLASIRTDLSLTALKKFLLPGLKTFLD